MAEAEPVYGTEPVEGPAKLLELRVRGGGHGELDSAGVKQPSAAAKTALSEEHSGRRRRELGRKSLGSEPSQNGEADEAGIERVRTASARRSWTCMPASAATSWMRTN